MKKLTLCILAIAMTLLAVTGCGSKSSESTPTPTPTPTPTATAKPTPTPAPTPNLDELYNTDKAAYYQKAIEQVAKDNSTEVNKCEYIPETVLRVELYAPAMPTKKMKLNNAKITLARLLEVIGPKLDVPLNIDVFSEKDGVQTVVVSADFEPVTVNAHAFTEADFSNISAYTTYWYVRPELQEYD